MLVGAPQPSGGRPGGCSGTVPREGAGNQRQKMNKYLFVKNKFMNSFLLYVEGSLSSSSNFPIRCNSSSGRNLKLSFVSVSRISFSLPLAVSLSV